MDRFTNQFPDLAKYQYRDLTPNIGGTFEESTQLATILQSPRELKQLALLSKVISMCGVGEKATNSSTSFHTMCTHFQRSRSLSDGSQKFGTGFGGSFRET